MITSTRSGLGEPITAGIVTALVGFTSSFVVVVAGLRAVGATPAQAASGLLALTATFAVGIIVLCVRYRRPITLAWSTPGAAMLVAAGTSYHAGWPAAVGAFLVVGVLILATGLIPALGELIGRIPTPQAQAMLAGVLLVLRLAPMRSLAAQPGLTIPILAVWLIAMRWLTRWALPLALVTALIVIGIWLAAHDVHLGGAQWWPQLTWTTPSFDPAAVIGIAIPLYIVTMASQNVPGVAVLKSFGYETPWRASMFVTGAGTVIGAPFGGHAINLAALSAALAAGDEAGADRSRRWIAGGVRRHLLPHPGGLVGRAGDDHRHRARRTTGSRCGTGLPGNVRQCATRRLHTRGVPGGGGADLCDRRGRRHLLGNQRCVLGVGRRSGHPRGSPGATPR